MDDPEILDGVNTHQSEPPQHGEKCMRLKCLPIEWAEDTHQGTARLKQFLEKFMRPPDVPC